MCLEGNPRFLLGLDCLSIFPRASSLYLGLDLFIPLLLCLYLFMRSRPKNVGQEWPPANQTKERSVHELFTGAFRNKSSM